MPGDIDESARVVDSTVGRTEIREFVTLHDSELGDGCRVYERSSLKRCRLADEVDINAGTYIENADLGPRVQVGPNCSIVGVTHELDDRGMTFRDDIADRIVLHAGVFVGAGATVGPGIEIGENSVIAAGSTVTTDVDPRQIVLGSPPTQRVEALETWLDR